MKLFSSGRAALATVMLGLITTHASQANDRAAQPPDLDDRVQLEQFVDGVVKAQMTTLDIPTAVIAVVKDGSPLLVKGYGYADRGSKTPIVPATSMFRVGSITKTFTWTAVMQLVEQGRIDLDADVNQYLRGFKIPATYPQPITMRHMMTHTTGFEDGGLGYLRGDPVANKSMQKTLAEHMPARVRPPGELPSYSNYAAALAGLIVENVSGVPYDEYIRRNIFERLDMRYATVEEVVPASLKPHIVTGYRNRGGNYEAGAYETIGGFRAAGSASVSALDMTHFMIAQLQDGRYGDARLMQPDSMRSMHATAFQSDPRLPGIALGFYEQSMNGVRALAHGGDTAMFHAYLWLIPEKNVGIFVDYVGDGGVMARDGLMAALFDRYFPEATRTKAVKSQLSDASARDRYNGSYRFLRRNWSDIDKALSLPNQLTVTALDNGRLLLSLPVLDNLQWLFEPAGPDLFRQVDGKRQIAFRVDGSGRATNLFLDLLPVAALDRTVWYERQDFWVPVLVLCGVLLMSMALVPVYRWRELAGLPLEPKRAIWLAVAATAWLMLTLISLIVAVSTTTVPLAWRIPIAFKMALALPIVFVILTAAMIWEAVRLWRRGCLGPVARLHYALVTAAALVVCLFLYQWNILGWQFG